MVKTEKRRRERVDFTVTAIFETADNERTDNQCVNLSMSGIFLQTANPMPVGTGGNLLIVLECGEERLDVRSKCQVARVVDEKSGQPAGMGLEFTYLGPDSSLVLYKIIKYQGGFNAAEGNV